MQGKLVPWRSSAVRFLDGAVQWHLVEWRDGLGLARTRLEGLTGWALDDTQSRSAFEALLRSRGLTPAAVPPLRRPDSA